MQTSMPIFAHDLGAGSAGSAYGVLLFANGAGGVIGGVLLEATGRIRPSVRAAVASTAIYGVTRSSSPSRPAIRSPSACS
jgi:MFS family permease